MIQIKKQAKLKTDRQLKPDLVKVFSYEEMNKKIINISESPSNFDVLIKPNLYVNI